MTGEHDAQLERRLNDQRAVQELLEEAGLANDPVLRQVLLQVRELRVSDIPAPSPRLRALLAAPELSAAGCQEPGKPRHKRRVVLTALAVAASLGVAGGAAAGNGDLRRGAEGSISTVAGWFAAPAPAAPLPTPAPEPEATSPAPAVVRVFPQAPTSSTPPVPVPGEGPAAGASQAGPWEVEGASNPTVTTQPGPGAQDTTPPPGVAKGPADGPASTAPGPPAQPPAAQPGAARPDALGRTADGGGAAINGSGKPDLPTRPGDRRAPAR
jgi:hypothetical protein